MEYVAFISYRHKDLDKQIAKKVHTMLERYHVPKELQKDGIGPKLGRVFRDEEELPVSSDLTGSIQTALDHSRFLLVVCTPDTPDSIWVEQEIKYFVEKHGREHVIGILVNGTPEESFPVPLTTDFAEDGKTVVHITEPLAANLTDVNHRYDAKRLKKEIMRLYAAILGCPFDSLWQRERRYKQRVAITALSAATCGLVAFSSYVYLKNKEITRQNEQILAQNEQISRQNEEIQEQNSELKRREAEALIREGSALIDGGNSRTAVKRVLAALETEEGKKAYSADAFTLLQDALAAGHYSNRMRTVGRVTQDNEIKQIKLSETGEYLFTRDYLGLVRCYRVEDGGLIWKADSQSGQLYHEVVKRDRMLVLEHVGETAEGGETAESKTAGNAESNAESNIAGIVLCCDESRITALSMQDGALLWEYGQDNLFVSSHFMQPVDFACVSEDGEQVALIEICGQEGTEAAWLAGHYDQGEYRLTVLDTVTGEIVKQIPLPAEIQKVLEDKAELKAMGSRVGAFSEDGNYVVGGVYGYSLDEGYVDKTYFFVADLQADTVSCIHAEEGAKYTSMGDWAQLLLGFYIDTKEKRTMVLRYDGNQQELCMDEFFWDGRPGERSIVPKELPRSITDDREWQSTFSTEHPEVVMATFGNTRVIYGKRDAALWGHQDYSYSIVHQQYLNKDDWSVWAYSMLTEEGVIQCFYQNGLAAENFCDKQHFAYLDITEGYAFTHSEQGHTLDQDAVAAVVCDDDLATVYFLQPERDPHIEIAEWSKMDDMQNFCTNALGNGRLAFCAATAEELVIRLVEEASGEVQKEYRFPLAENTDLKYLASSPNRYVYWPDGTHLTFGWNDLSIFDLEKGQWEPVFGEESVKCQQVVTAGDKVLHVGLASDGEGNTETGKNYIDQLYVRLDGGEVQVKKLDTDQCLGDPFFAPQAYLKAGENGMVLIGQYADGTQEKMDSFLVYDVTEDKTYTLKDSCPQGADRILSMAKETPYFATVDTDGMLRIYDIKAQAVKQEIPLREGSARVERMTFCHEDKAICIYEKDHFMIYDLEAGALAYEESIQGTGFTTSTTLYSIDDPARNRIYLRLSTGATLCVDTATWQKIAYYGYLDVFSAATNKAYIENSGIRRVGEEQGMAVVSAYTLEDLVAWGKEW